jgi:hypothetical protein
VAQRLGRFDLQRVEPPTGDEPGPFEDLLPESARSGYFLGFYTRAGLETALERYGYLGEIRRRGLSRLLLACDTDDPFHHRLRIHCDGHESEETLLVDLRVHLGYGLPDGLPEEALGDAPAEFIVVEWLAMQHPHLAFRPDRPPLPGQQHPGLGLGRETLVLLGIMTERLQKGALLATPAWYHNADLYRRWSCFFADPECEGRFGALACDLGGLGLHQASWAMELGCVRDLDAGQTDPGGANVRWNGCVQVLPLCSSLREHFRSDAYWDLVEAAASGARFGVDRQSLAERLGGRRDRPMATVAYGTASSADHANDASDVGDLPAPADQAAAVPWAPRPRR